MRFTNSRLPPIIACDPRHANASAETVHPSPCPARRSGCGLILDEARRRERRQPPVHHHKLSPPGVNGSNRYSRQSDRPRVVQARGRCARDDAFGQPVAQVIVFGPAVFRGNDRSQTAMACPPPPQFRERIRNSHFPTDLQLSQLRAASGRIPGACEFPASPISLRTPIVEGQ